MKFLTMEDETARFEVTLFPRAYQRTGHAIAERNHGPFVIDGKVEDDDGNLAVNGERLQTVAGTGRVCESRSPTQDSSANNSSSLAS